jgi:hypothetical protein
MICLRDKKDVLICIGCLQYKFFLKDKIIKIIKNLFLLSFIKSNCKNLLKKNSKDLFIIYLLNLVISLNFKPIK